MHGNRCSVINSPRLSSLCKKNSPITKISSPRSNNKINNYVSNCRYHFISSWLLELFLIPGPNAAVISLDLVFDAFFQYRRRLPWLRRRL